MNTRTLRECVYSFSRYCDALFNEDVSRIAKASAAMRSGGAYWQLPVHSQPSVLSQTESEEILEQYGPGGSLQVLPSQEQPAL